MRSTARDGSSCSQIRMTRHPACLRCSFVAMSRATFFANFSDHHVSFTAGRVACSGQECQKHPSTKIATLARVKAMSIERRFIPGMDQATRYRRPLACRSLRIETSGPVSLRRCLLIRADTPGELGEGMVATPERYPLSPVPDTEIVIICSPTSRWEGARHELMLRLSMDTPDLLTPPDFRQRKLWQHLTGDTPP